MDGELLVISADTIITFNGKIYEKPQDSKGAIETLKLFSSNTHTVMTAVCLKSKDRVVEFVEETKVTFGDLSDELIRDYVATSDPM